MARAGGRGNVDLSDGRPHRPGRPTEPEPLVAALVPPDHCRGVWFPTGPRRRIEFPGGIAAARTTGTGALEQLSDSDRALLHLYYFESQTLGEIETILSVPKANLKMRLARARARLRSLLEGTRDAG